MSKNSCCDQKLKLKKGLWSPEEDEKLIKHVEKYGPGCWSAVPKQAGLQRCGKSCRLRWINYLRPDLKRGTFSPEEEKLIIDLQAELGNRWSQIATQLPGRTDNEIKNFWNSCLRKHLRETASDASTDHHGESISIREGSETTGSKDIIDASQRHIIYENPHIASDRNLPLVFQSAYNNPVIALLNQSADSSCAEWHIKGSDHNAISSEGFMCAAEMAHPPGMGVSDSFGSTGLLNKPLQINSELTFSREVGELNTLIMANSTMFRRTSDSHGDQDSMGLLKWSDLVLPTACSSSTHGGIYNHSESKAEVVLFPENSADSKSIA